MSCFPFKKVDSKKLILWGYGLEFFDLYLYIHLAYLINRHFFPDGDPFWMQGFALFNLYFLAPVSCMFFSYFGDKFGRKKVIVSTSFAMALASFGIVCLPTYETWGVVSSGLLVCLRVLQGIFLSGETITSWIYMAESADIKKAPFYLSILGATELGAGICALLLGYVTIQYDWSWRVPFGFTALFVCFSLILRKYLSESPEFTKYFDAKISIFDSFKMADFYKSLPFKTRNFWCAVVFFPIYPIAFVIAYIHLGNLLIAKNFLTQQDLLLHNALVSVIEICCGLFIGFLTLKLPSLNVQYITVGKKVLLTLSCLIFALHPSLLTTYGGIFTLQCLLVTLSMASLIIASCFRTLPTIGRCSLAGTAWAVGKIAGFFLMLYINKMANDFYLSHVLFVYSALCMAGIIAVYSYVPYERLDEEALKRTSRKQPLPSDQTRVIEIKEIYGVDYER